MVWAVVVMDFGISGQLRPLNAGDLIFARDHVELDGDSPFLATL